MAMQGHVTDHLFDPNSKAISCVIGWPRGYPFGW